MDPKELNFLLVDDNFLMLKMMKSMLKDLGYANFTMASDGLEAWQVLEAGEENIHIVLSDLIMPKMDGLEFLGKIRESEEYWELPFIMITGEENQTKLMSMLEGEVSSYILKPFTHEKFKKEINTVLEDKFNPTPYLQAIRKGRTLLQQGDKSDLAMKAFMRARELEIDKPDPHYFIGLLNFQQGKTKEARLSLEKALLLRESYSRAYDTLARIYRSEGDYAKEAEILKKVVDLAPEDMRRNIELAQACAKMGWQTDVANYLGTALKKAKKNRAALETIIRCYLTAGLANEAEDVYRKHIDPPMQKPRLINKYALIIKEHKDHERAAKFLNAIVAIWRTQKNHGGISADEMAVYYFNLGVIHTEKANLQKGGEEARLDYKTAVSVINKALDCNHRHKDAGRLLDWLEKKIDTLDKQG